MNESMDYTDSNLQHPYYDQTSVSIDVHTNNETTRPTSVGNGYSNCTKSVLTTVASSSTDRSCIPGSSSSSNGSGTLLR